MARPVMLYVVTEDWYFWSHRLEIARAARAAGFDVAVATRVAAHGPRIEGEGFTLYPLRLRRSSMNPLRELAAVAELRTLYSRVLPTVVHHVALKPVLYGSFAARISRVPAVVNAMTGMGFVFTSDRAKARLLRPAVVAAFRMALRRSHIILQNDDDRDVLVGAGAATANQVSIIRGSGVDISRFVPTPEPDGPLVVVLPARMLWDKGVGEYVAAARLLRTEGLIARFLLVGERDAENPSAVPEAQLQTWHAEGVVEWLGRRDDMPRVFQQAHVVCLPSYREGLPKALLEAAASSRAIVTTDVPGCRDVVHDGDNGLLVPRGDSVALAAALRRLLQEPDTRRRMGAAGRQRAEAEFASSRITEESLAVYRRAMAAADRTIHPR
jgi:glycosyltransferase involved in cell wall biosynthesis